MAGRSVHQGLRIEKKAIATRDRPGRSTERTSRTGRPRRRKEARPLDSKRAVLLANEHIVRHYPIGLMGGLPRRLRLGKAVCWIVPIVLTSPGYGMVGEVGMVAVDDRTGRVVGSTPRQEAAAATKKLREGKLDALEAAFLRARTV